MARKTGPKAEHAGRRQQSHRLKNCRNVLLRDFSILHGGHFGILATGVDNFTIDNLKIDTNRDGMDIDCCRNVRVSNCSVNSPWDDGICLKSSFALGYARATEMVTISELPGDRQLRRGNAARRTASVSRPMRCPAHRPDQVRHRIQRRLQEHHDFELRLRWMPRPGHRERRWRHWLEDVT
jgi:hypothetical protein